MRDAAPDPRTARAHALRLPLRLFRGTRGASARDPFRHREFDGVRPAWPPGPPEAGRSTKKGQAKDTPRCPPPDLLTTDTAGKNLRCCFFLTSPSQPPAGVAETKQLHCPLHPSPLAQLLPACCHIIAPCPPPLVVH